MPFSACQSTRRAVCAAALAALLAILAPWARAQQAAPAQPAPPATPVAPSTLLLTPEAIQARMKQVEDSKDLTDEQKRAAVDLYKQALEQLQIAAERSARAAELENLRKSAPDLLASIKAELAKPPEEPKPAVPPDASLAQLEQRAGQAEADLATAKRKAADLEAEAKRRTERRTETPKLVAAARQELDDVTRQLAARTAGNPPPEEGQPQQVARASRTLLLARKKALEEGIKLYESALLSSDARTELLAAQRDQVARQILQGEKLLKAWHEIVSERRRQDADTAARQAREARRAAATALPAVRKLADENAQLAERRTGPQGLASRIERASGQLQEANARLGALKDELKSLEDKVDAVGLTRPVALLLRRKRASLPDVHLYRRSVAARQAEISLAQLDMIELEEQRSALANLEPRVAEIMDGLEQPASKEQREDLKAAIREQLETQRSYLDALIADYNRYFATLVDLDAAERQLIAAAGNAADYIDERILWVRSAPPLQWACLVRASYAIAWLLSPPAWGGVLRALGSEAWANLPLFGLAALILAGLFYERRRLRDRLERIAAMVPLAEKDSFAHTLRALAITALLAAPWPLLMAFVGWQLAVPGDASEFAKGVGAGLLAAAGIYAVMESFRTVCLPRGLGETHFRWRREATEHIRRHLVWLMAAVVPARFVVSTLGWQANEAWEESLGRIVFILGLLALAAFLRVAFRPGGQVMKAVLDMNRGGWLDRLRHVWHPVAVLLPVALAVMAAFGHFYTARHLEVRLQATLLLLLGVVLVRALTVRALFVLHRKVALRQALARRAAQSAEAAEGEGAPGGAEGPDATPSRQESLHVLSLQTRRLMHGFAEAAVLVGLWLIWSDVLPALGILKSIALWSSGTASVTLADLALAVLIFVLTIVAGRNVPGLVELIILHRLPLDHGIRFAITAISRYLIIVVGVVLSLGTIGVGWSKVQWLVAAITVGLGFGLQEIFANFVSGLIILFERPMRVGDTVTVGDTTGTVTDIRIRATTILDWDRKELIVPNKEFITGRLVNWTLSDSISRMRFPVGIAYGSDTALAERVLLQVAMASPHVLDEPSPTVVFKGFGDSALNFELRVYIPNMNCYWKAWHEVNMAIDAAFRKAGIEIAFPQRDVHVRSVRALFPPPGKEGGAEKP